MRWPDTSADRSSGLGLYSSYPSAETHKEGDFFDLSDSLDGLGDVLPLLNGVCAVATLLLPIVRVYMRIMVVYVSLSHDVEICLFTGILHKMKRINWICTIF
jgi:hypothetical protein